MIRPDRAKQFAPFEALNGLRQALAKKEREHEMIEKCDISEELTEKINATLMTLSKGDSVKIIVFEEGYYVEIKGKIEKIDLIYKYIIVDKAKIYFSDLFGLEKL